MHSVYFGELFCICQRFQLIKWCKKPLRTKDCWSLLGVSSLLHNLQATVNQLYLAAIKFSVWAKVDLFGAL